MRPRPKSCIICGVLVEDGQARCELHRSQAGRRLRPCIVCGRPGPADYCEAHDPTRDEAARLERQPYRQAYLDPFYRKNRDLRFRLAKGRCEGCGSQLEAGTWEAHHVIPVRLGGTNGLENLRVVCQACHKWASAR